MPIAQHRVRAAVAAAGALTLIAALTGCGTSAGDTSSNLTLWSEWTNGAGGAGIAHTIDSWNKANPDLKVKHRPIGNEQYFPALRTGLSGTNPPDVIMLEPYQNTRDFVKANKLVDMTSWWTAHKSNFIQADAQSTVRACTVNGKVYCVPVGFNSHDVIYYNADLLAKYNMQVPTDYDQFLAEAAAFKSKGITPISLGDKDGWPGSHWYFNFVVQRCGASTVYSAIEYTGAKWNDPCFVQAATDLAKLAKAGYFPPGVASDDYDAMTALFLSGKVPFMQTGSWFAGGLVDQPASFKLGTMAIPKITGAAHSSDVVGEAGDTIAIPTKGHNRAQVYKFLNLLTSQTEANFWAKQGYISAVKGAVANDGPPIIQKILADFDSATGVLAGVDLEVPPKLGEDVMYNQVSQLLTGSVTPQQFSDKIQATAEAVK